MRNKKFDSIEYQLGTYIGEYVFLKYLPTLSCDMCHTNIVIDVTPEETIEEKRLSDIWFKKSMKRRGDSTISTDAEWNELRAYHCFLEKKYLPPVLEVRLYPLNVTNLAEVKAGIRQMLWDCDMCHYRIETDDDISITCTMDFLRDTMVLNLLTLKVSINE